MPIGTLRTIEPSQRRYARVAGVAYLASFATVTFAQFRIHARLIVEHDAAQTARNILAHETLFRVGIVCGLLYCAGLVVLLVALYEVLKPVSRGLALLAACWRLVYAVVWAVMTIYLFSALRLTHYADYMQVFDVGRVQALARFYLSARFDLYYVALLFYGLASSVSGYLWFKSRYIPRGLAAFGMVSSAFCVVCTLAFLVAPGFDNIVGLWLFDTPMGIFDIVTSFWLLFRGLPRRASEN